MNATILNRKNEHPADGWYHIEPTGEFPGVADDGTKIVEVIDGPAVDSIVSVFNREVADYESAHPNATFPGLLLDRDHLSHDETKETAADGWLKALRNREGLLEGEIAWTPRGKSAVDGGEYKFFSTEYPPDGLEILNKDAQGRLRVRPLRLSGLSLTNRPNNVGARPITNRKTSPDDPAARTARETADTQKAIMKKVAEKLGLSAEASEDAILEAMQKLIDQAKAGQDKEKENTGLKNRIKELESDEVAADLAAAGITDEAAIGQLAPYLGTLKNREARTAFLKTIKPEAQAAGSPMTLKNRAKTPPAGKAEGEHEEPSQADQARAIRIRNRAAELRTTDGRLSLSAAYNRAAAQVDSEIAAGK